MSLVAWERFLNAPARCTEEMTSRKKERLGSKSPNHARSRDAGSRQEASWPENLTQIKARGESSITLAECGIRSQARHPAATSNWPSSMTMACTRLCSLARRRRLAGRMSQTGRGSTYVRPIGVSGIRTNTSSAPCRIRTDAHRPLACGVSGRHASQRDAL